MQPPEQEAACRVVPLNDRRCRGTHMPSFPEIHPEFGYFCPSPDFRRRARLVLLTAGIGAIFGAAGVLALAPRADPAHGPEAALAAAALAAPAPEPSSLGSESAPPTTGTVATPTATASAKSCKEQTWPYLDDKCLSGKLRRWHHVRVLPPDAPAQSASSSVDTASTITQPESTNAASKKPEKSRPRRAKTRNRDRDYESDARSAYATRYGGTSYDRGAYYERPSRQNRDGWSW
jgi:hypothetical protein